MNSPWPKLAYMHVRFAARQKELARTTSSPEWRERHWKQYTEDRVNARWYARKAIEELRSKAHGKV